MKLLLILSAIHIAYGSIKDCDTASIFRPTVLSLTPDPPVPNNSVYLSLIFDNTGPEVSSGSVFTTITVNGLPYSETKPLCEDTACPLTAGLNNRSTESIWPSVTGKVVSKILWTGTNGESLLCIEINCKIYNFIKFTPVNQHKNIRHKNNDDMKFFGKLLKRN